MAIEKEHNNIALLESVQKLITIYGVEEATKIINDHTIPGTIAKPALRQFITKFENVFKMPLHRVIYQDDRAWQRRWALAIFCYCMKEDFRFSFGEMAGIWQRSKSFYYKNYLIYLKEDKNTQFFKNKIQPLLEQLEIKSLLNTHSNSNLLNQK